MFCFSQENAHYNTNVLRNKPLCPDEDHVVVIIVVLVTLDLCRLLCVNSLFLPALFGLLRQLPPVSDHPAPSLDPHPAADGPLVGVDEDESAVDEVGHVEADEVADARGPGRAQPEAVPGGVHH